ncbi:unnamed protein product [Leuciscus chuanchicus]
MVVWLKRSSLAKPVLKEKQRLLYCREFLMRISEKQNSLSKLQRYFTLLCISAEKSPMLGQILPILDKLQHHFTVNDEDSSFTNTIKNTIWNDLSKRYQIIQGLVVVGHEGHSANAFSQGLSVS